MFPQDRQQRILELLRTQTSVASSNLADLLGVNQATIRRDLKALADEGYVHLVHGGARRADQGAPLVHEVDLATKQVTNVHLKQIIADKAAALVTSGTTVALNAGSTAELIAANIPAGVSNCTFVTLSLNIAATLAPRTDSRLVLAGGVYRSTSQSFVGQPAVDLLSGLRADIAFLGASAVDTESGWTHPTLEEVRPNQVMLAMAAARYLVCDSSKFGVTALARVAGLDEFTGIISDGVLDVKVERWARDHGLEII